MQHLDEGLIHTWLDGALDVDEAARVAQHVATCATCASAVAEARGLIAGTSRLLMALDDVPASVLPPGSTAAPQSGKPQTVRRWFRGPMMPLAIAASLALVMVSVYHRRVEEPVLTSSDFHVAPPVPAPAGAAAVAGGVAAVPTTRSTADAVGAAADAAVKTELGGRTAREQQSTAPGGGRVAGAVNPRADMGTAVDAVAPRPRPLVVAAAPPPVTAPPAPPRLATAAAANAIDLGRVAAATATADTLLKRADSGRASATPTVAQSLVAISAKSVGVTATGGAGAAAGIGAIGAGGAASAGGGRGGGGGGGRAGGGGGRGGRAGRGPATNAEAFVGCYAVPTTLTGAAAGDLADVSRSRLPDTFSLRIDTTADRVVLFGVRALDSMRVEKGTVAGLTWTFIDGVVSITASENGIRRTLMTMTIGPTAYLATAGGTTQPITRIPCTRVNGGQ